MTTRIEPLSESLAKSAARIDANPPEQKRGGSGMVNGGKVGAQTKQARKVGVSGMVPNVATGNTMGGGPKSDGRSYKK